MTADDENYGGAIPHLLSGVPVRSVDDIVDLAGDYGVPALDAVMIAANFSGARTELQHPRARFQIWPDGPITWPELFQLILPLDNPESPFLLTDVELSFDDQVVARVQNVENDDVVIAYPRKGGRAMTVNTYARSQCTGCIFCPNVIEDAADDKLLTVDALVEFLDLARQDYGWNDLSHLDRLTVSSGCFLNEPAAIDHLILLRKAAASLGFGGVLHILSSVIRTKDGLTQLAAEAGPFYLSLTLECFERRDLLLKDSKASLTFDVAKQLMADCRDVEVDVDFTYVVGLDGLDTAVTGTRTLLDNCTVFPKLQVYQAHNAFMRHSSHPDARHLSYFFAYRQAIDDIAGEISLRPESWENYRPLWYTRFGDEPLRCLRI